MVYLLSLEGDLNFGSLWFSQFSGHTDRWHNLFVKRMLLWASAKAEVCIGGLVVDHYGPLSHLTRCKCTYLLTHSMVQSPSWEANWSAASQEIPPISQNPKVHYRTHKRPPPVSILGHPNPILMHTSHFLEIHPNIIRPSTPRSPQWSPSLRFPHQDLVHPPLLTHTRYMPSPSHSHIYKYIN